MCYSQPDFLARLRQLVAHLVPDYSFHDDLIQLALAHLSNLGSEELHHKPSWYLQRCKFVILNRLKSGRSLDSPKRRHLRCQLQNDSPEPEVPAPPALVSRINVAEEVSARDILDVLCSHLCALDCRVLGFLVHGFDDTDIAQELDLDRSAVSRRRKRIADTAVRLGISS